MKSGNSIKRPMTIMLVAVFGVVAALAFFKYRQISAAIANSANFAPPPESVTSMKIKKSSWTPSINVIASLEATQGSVLKAEEKGRVVSAPIESGSEVKAGDVLVQLDISVEQAQLKSAEALADLARLTFNRTQQLRAGNAMAQSSLDEATAALKQAEGNVAGIRAVIAKKTITAPFAGRAGIRMVNVGQYVSEGAAIMPLFAYDPIYANFMVPQRHLKDLSPGQTVVLSLDTYPGAEFRGTVTAVDPQVDETSRNIKVQATFSNTEGKLRPGMFADAQVLLANSEDFVTIPGSSVSHAPYGDSVYIIENQKSPDGSKEFLGVTQKFVKLGQRRGDQVAVLQGLEPGQEIVTSGVFKLRPGAPVSINNSVSPGNSAAPNPEDT